MKTSTAILTVMGLAGVGLIVFLIYNNNKKPALPVNLGAGSGNNLNLNLGSLGNTQTDLANLGGVGTTPLGVPTVNGMTAAEYATAGFTPSEVEAMFSNN